MGQYNYDRIHSLRIYIYIYIKDTDNCYDSAELFQFCCCCTRKILIIDHTASSLSQRNLRLTKNSKIWHQRMSTRNDWRLFSVHSVTIELNGFWLFSLLNLQSSTMSGNFSSSTNVSENSTLLFNAVGLLKYFECDDCSVKSEFLLGNLCSVGKWVPLFMDGLSETPHNCNWRGSLPRLIVGIFSSWRRYMLW